MQKIPHFLPKKERKKLLDLLKYRLHLAFEGAGENLSPFQNLVVMRAGPITVAIFLLVEQQTLILLFFS